MHDEQLAEDAVSMAFIAVAKNMGMVKEAISPQTKRLLLTIVQRTAINLYHKQRGNTTAACNWKKEIL